VPNLGRSGESTVRRVAILIVLMTATTLLLAGAAFTQSPERQEEADPYIVVLDESVDNPRQVAQGIEGRQEGLEVGFVYGAAIEGFSAEIPDDSVDEVRNNPRVAYVERDTVMRVEAQTLPWGVNRIGADESSTVAGDNKGTVSGVNFYVIDTGIDKKHGDLNVVKHVNLRSDGKNWDCDGHGTHVAGTLAAKDNRRNVVGVAPGARLTAVKVLNCRGIGSKSRVIAGINWVTRHAQKPAVANISVGGGASQAVDDAVEASADSGIFYSVSAGNQDKDACNRSPARAGDGTDNGIVTTAATTKKSGAEAGYSNHGSCVDLWAPGNRILSTKLGGGTMLSSGTSMAAPHVGGTAALYLSIPANALASSVQVETELKEQADPTGKTSDDRSPIQLVDASEY
jgi:subtilisin family serine protease